MNQDSFRRTKDKKKEKEKKKDDDHDDVVDEVVMFLSFKKMCVSNKLKLKKTS